MTASSLATFPHPSILDEPIKPHIDIAKLSQSLCPLAKAFELEIIDETGSTNTDLMQRLREKGRYDPRTFSPVVRLAYKQTAGRGRHGRVWHARAGDALLFSLAITLKRPLVELMGLSLAVGTAIVAGLRDLPQFPPEAKHRLSLKWPNDVLLDGDKLAGILIETARHTLESSTIIIGIGLNLYDETTLDAQLDPSAPRPAALSRVLPHVSMTQTFAALLNALAVQLARFDEMGFAPFQAAWQVDHAYTGQSIVLIDARQQTIRGIALGVDAQGRLRIDTEQGIQSVASGESTLRLYTSTSIDS